MISLCFLPLPGNLFDFLTKSVERVGQFAVVNDQRGNPCDLEAVRLLRHVQKNVKDVAIGDQRWQALLEADVYDGERCL